MGSKFAKQLHKLSKKEFEKFEQAWNQVVSGDWTGLDIIPLKGYENHYRMRIGSMRLQFFVNDAGEYIPTSYAKRKDDTYKNKK